MTFTVFVEVEKYIKKIPKTVFLYTFNPETTIRLL